MGPKQGKEASVDDTKEFFKSPTYTFSACVDIDKLMKELVNPA